MSDQEPKCFARDLDGIKLDSPSMNISVVLDEVKKGIYGRNLELIESYYIDKDIPLVLRIIARITESDGLVLVHHDDEFDQFIMSMGFEIPNSQCLKYLQTLEAE